MNWNWIFRYILFGPLLRVLFRVHVVGSENLPSKGPFIVAAGSHTTAIESAILAVYLRRYALRFFAKAEYWRTSKFIGWFMTHTGQIALERTDSRSADEAINKGVGVLRSGGNLAVYPEGTRSKDGRLHKGRTGVVRTSIRAGGIPIIPVGLIGMEKFSPPGKGIRPGMATIIIGKPINPFHYMELAERAGVTSGKALEHVLSRPVTDVLMKEISRLSVKEYSNEYLDIPSPKAK